MTAAQATDDIPGHVDRFDDRECVSNSLLNLQAQGDRGTFPSQPSPPAWLWQVLLGHMSSLEKLIPHGHLGMRYLQFQLKSHWYSLEDDTDLLIPLLQHIWKDLSWWLVDKHLHARVPLSQAPPEVLFFSDSCENTPSGTFHIMDVS